MAKRIKGGGNATGQSNNEELLPEVSELFLLITFNVMDVGYMYLSQRKKTFARNFVKSIFFFPFTIRCYLFMYNNGIN